MSASANIAPSVERTHAHLIDRLLRSRADAAHWEGTLSSSALATATAVVALTVARDASDDRALVDRGLQWLAAHQNADGGWGDTPASRSNISTTALCWAALAAASAPPVSSAVPRCEAWLSRAAGGLQPEQLRTAIEQRYGKDRTFSVPILTTLALSGRLGPRGWSYVPQLPFELAACPPRWFQWLQLPVVSYALPALIAIGQVRHHQRPSRNIVLRVLRNALRRRTSTMLRQIQPSTGGYLEATPLTSFVVMSLAGAGQTASHVAREGLRFLRESARADGSWPVDTNLATWVTTLAVNALAASRDGISKLSPADRAAITRWLLDQQHRELHAYTQAAPGGWAWTPLPGGVPDADDTAGALLALAELGAATEGSGRAACGGQAVRRAEGQAVRRADQRLHEAVSRGVGWLLDLQNRDGGIPTFCRGWGALPFDRSAPDLTAHALQAWAVWQCSLPAHLQSRVASARPRALAYLGASQHADGSWLPLWFGNEHAPGEVNATYGTAKVLLALAALDVATADPLIGRGLRWILAAQNADGGWGGAVDAPSSIEETSFAVDALAAVSRRPGVTSQLKTIEAALGRGVAWLVTATEQGTATPASPIGLYFAKLWYAEALYPLIFATAALGRAR